MPILYLSTLAWDEAGGAHNPTQIARALARQGHTVLFVEPQPSATREVYGLPLEVVALTELGMTPAQLRRAWYGLDSGDLATVAYELMTRVQRMGSTQVRAAIYSAPFDPYVRLAPLVRRANFTLAYYAMDDFAAAPALGYTQYALRAQEYLVRESDVLASVTPHAARTLERFGKRAYVIPNGARLGAAIASDAAPIARGELTLGFWGTLMDTMFDADLIAHIARARPAWTIHLLGAVDPEPHRPSVAAQLEHLPNVILHGTVAHTELPRYAAAFDVALAPFPDNAFTGGRDPIKVYEYLAAHLPVVASHAPQLADIPYVQVANSSEEFVRAIETAARVPVDARVLDAYLAAQTWDARAETLLNLLNQVEPSARAAGALLPSFAEPDAAAVMRYVQALEQELEQVQAWAQELESIARTRGRFQRVKRLVPTLRRRA